MSVRRRRLSGTGAVCVAVWAAFSSFTPSTAEAFPQARVEARPVVAVSGERPFLATLDMIIVRPLTILRRPGEASLIIAHRGDSFIAPENTLPAFQSTTAAGAEYFEIDVRMSKDAVPVVIHDSTVDRTTDGTGVVADMTIAQLRALDAGSWFSNSFAGTRIPTLDEALAQAVTSSTDVVIEYKGAWSKADIQTTITMIEAAGLEDRIVAQSFSAKTVANFSEVAPGLVVGWLTDAIDASIVATAVDIGADAVNPQIATARGVALAHDHKLGVFVWTHDADADWESLTAMGVDGIITNRPDALHKWMGIQDRARNTDATASTTAFPSY